jgi:hypothetical protein
MLDNAEHSRKNNEHPSGLVVGTLLSSISMVLTYSFLLQYRERVQGIGGNVIQSRLCW